MFVPVLHAPMSRTLWAQLLVGACALGVAAGGVVAAGDVRAENDRAARARAEAAYLERFRPLAESVFDHAQPLQDAFDAFDTPQADDGQVRDDVFASGDAEQALRARLAELSAAEPPPRYQVAAGRAVEALETLADAAARLEKATTEDSEDGTEEGFVLGYDEGQQLLENGELAWTTSVLDLFGDLTPPSLPATMRGAAQPGRSPRSKGAYLYAVDRICARAFDASDRLPTPQDLGQLLRTLPKELRLGLGAADKLRAVPLPVADDAQLKAEVQTPLAGFRSQAGLLERSLVRALEKGQPATEKERAAGLRIDATLRTLSKGYARYGATLCQDYFDPGPVQTDGAEPGEDSTLSA